MEKKLYIKNLTCGAVTAVGYLPPKREVISGHEGEWGFCSVH